jgi:protein-L-isoaspartate(D-aspartate) O-methyltransferase
VRDPAVLNAFATVARERFVLGHNRALAYMDAAIPAAEGVAGSPVRTLLAPMALARMLEFAAPARADRVLDVGGVTGYSAAILAQLCAKVNALEASETLAEEMRRCLKAAGADTVSVNWGPLNGGLAAAKPFDLIVLNGAVPAAPNALLDQLAEGGRLVTIVQNGWQGQAYLYTKNAEVISGRAIFDAGAGILPGFEEKQQFLF